MKIRLEEADLFHADGHTEMMKVIVAFRNFAKTPKNSSHFLPSIIAHIYAS
jgi:hypothetical protein